jgi:hypothetical protein
MASSNQNSALQNPRTYEYLAAEQKRVVAREKLRQKIDVAKFIVTTLSDVSIAQISRGRDETLAPGDASDYEKAMDFLVSVLDSDE